jgi:hypothetical protein
VVVYFTSQSSAGLYITIFSFSLIVWLACLIVLHSYCQKIDVKPLKKAWEQFINNEELLGQINRHFARIETLVRARAGQEPLEKEPDDTMGGTKASGQNPE